MLQMWSVTHKEELSTSCPEMGNITNSPIVSPSINTSSTSLVAKSSSRPGKGGQCRAQRYSQEEGGVVVALTTALANPSSSSVFQLVPTISVLVQAK